MLSSSMTANTETMHNIKNQSLLVAHEHCNIAKKVWKKKLAFLKKKKRKLKQDTKAKHKLLHKRLQQGYRN